MHHFLELRNVVLREQHALSVDVVWQTTAAVRCRNSAGQEVFPLLLSGFQWLSDATGICHVCQPQAQRLPAWGSDVRILQLLFFLCCKLRRLNRETPSLCDCRGGRSVWRRGEVKGFSLTFSNTSENWMMWSVGSWVDIKMNILEQSTIKIAIKWDEGPRKRTLRQLLNKIMLHTHARTHIQTVFKKCTTLDCSVAFVRTVFWIQARAFVGVKGRLCVA